MAKKESQHRQETLRECVNRIASEKGGPGGALTAEAIAQAARRAGHDLSNSYVTKILAGTSKNPSVAKIEALAAGLGVSPNVLLNAAQGRVPSEDEALKNRVSALFSRAQDLESGEDQDWFEKTIAMIERELDYRLRQRGKKK